MWPPPATKERAGTKMVYPAYYTYTCDVCEEFITVWADTRLEYVTLPATGVVSASMTDQGKYPWSYNSAAQRFESGNVNVDKSISTTSFVFTLDRQRTIAFDFGVSSEEKCDQGHHQPEQRGGDQQHRCGYQRRKVGHLQRYPDRRHVDAHRVL